MLNTTGPQILFGEVLIVDFVNQLLREMLFCGFSLVFGLFNDEVVFLVDILKHRIFIVEILYLAPINVDLLAFKVLSNH